MSNIVIKAENVSKLYRLGQVGSGSIQGDLKRWWWGMTGKGDPFAKIGETNDRSTKGNSEYVWSLKDINFEIQQGDAVGIIGRNGAGKSTLLKILSKTTSPTTGKIGVKGRIASLLEVGTGFHPELTGRENIFLNGAILGMSKREIKKKFDEIVDFSGVERYIDTPVKRYSSGMYVRLAFAVAAHLESEILIVDEVLAVGDAEFQKKCLGKMGDVSKGEGRTVLFVSHNMAAINNLCNFGVLLDNGFIKYTGGTDSCINQYLLMNNKKNNSNIDYFISIFQDDDFKFIGFNIFQENNENKSEFKSNENIIITYRYQLKKNIFGFRIGFDLINKVNQEVVFRSFQDDLNEELEEQESGIYESTFIIPKNLLKTTTYTLNIICGIHNNRWIIYNEMFHEIKILNLGIINKNYSDERPGVILPKINCKTIKYN